MAATPSYYGFLADRNEIANPAGQNPCTVTSNAAWALTAPLLNLMGTPLADRAVSNRIGYAKDPVTSLFNPLWIRFEWATPIYLSYSGLFDTNLRQSAYCRMQAFADAEMQQERATTCTVTGRDRRVMPGLSNPKKLRVGAPNWLRGDLDPRDERLYPKNVHARVPLCRVKVVLWTLWGPAYRPDGSADTGYRIGLAWAGDGLAFARHVGASGESAKSNDERIETAGGSVWIEPGISKRVAVIDRSINDKTLRDALFDMANRTGKRKPLVWLPDSKPENCFRYGGLFRRSDDHTQTYIAPRHTNAKLELEEWRE